VTGFFVTCIVEYYLGFHHQLNDIRARFVGCQTSEFHPCGGLYFGRDHFYFVGWQRYAMGDPNLIDTLTMVSNKSIEYLSNHIPGFVVSE
jgi:hypothetical protein